MEEDTQEAVDEIIDTVLHGGGSRGDVEEQFEQVSLKDQEKSVTQSQVDTVRSSTNSDNASQFSMNEDMLEYSSGKDMVELDIGLDNIGFNPLAERHLSLSVKQSASPASIESPSSMYSDTGYSSPISSPAKPKPKPTMPNVSPELLHLVDSAIMGKVEGMEKLKRVVSGKENVGREDEADCIALLVVDSLLGTMGGVECFEEGEDNNPPSVMLNSRAATVAGELIPSLPCEGDYDAGLLGVLLQSAEKIFVHDKDSTNLLPWDESHGWKGKQRSSKHAFEFDGESSGLLGPGESRWPFTNGYAFATWIYIESFADTLNTATAAAEIAAAAAAATSGKSSPCRLRCCKCALLVKATHMPRLFSFLSADNQGIEAYFHAQFLVVECGSGKGKKASFAFHSCIQATALRRRRQCPLFAEMGPIYIFKEIIGPERMARLASRGGDVLPSFELGGSLHLLYHPKLLSGRFCPDASPSGAAGTHRRPAEVLGQVHAATLMLVTEALWALAYGGPMSFATSGNLGKQNGVGDEELVAAIKKLLSSLADMVFTESSVMRDANAVQMLLDSCRRCYWVIREKDSVNTFSLQETPRPVGEVNALVDELLVVIELLVGGAAPSVAPDDVRCLIGFLVDCPQPNQVVKVLHLIYRLVVQPNTLRAHTFAESFLSCGGIETLLVLLQREAKAGDNSNTENSIVKNEENEFLQGSVDVAGIMDEISHNETLVAVEGNESVSDGEAFELQLSGSGSNSIDASIHNSIDRRTPVSENLLVKNLGGISFSITADSARNNVYNNDNGDGIVVRIISLLGALVAAGHLKFGAHTPSNMTSSILGNGLHDGGGTMFDDKLSLLLFALQKALQVAPRRLMTTNVYMALLAASVWLLLLF
ncbi:hypothetical protein IFM89_026835 [Coptis chinensis]|uniref:DUF4704 domain-containing protein n=1 Tax=Coptis chinensis TaxID=261450 RepID=A0A835HY83_9MAGN|nr:hypothetical protein IFM89_026835 [Coptis chinensis]